MTMSPGCRVGTQDLFESSCEAARPVDGAVDRPRARSGQSPAALRETYCVCHRTLGAWSWTRAPAEGPTIPPQEIVRNAGFIEKNQACRIPGRRGSVPHDPRGRDVRSIVFGGPDRCI